MASSAWSFAELSTSSGMRGSRGSDGTVASARHDVNAPERDLTVQRQCLSEKFMALAEPVLGDPGARGLLTALSELEGGHSISALMARARR